VPAPFVLPLDVFVHVKTSCIAHSLLHLSRSGGAIVGLAVMQNQSEYPYGIQDEHRTLEIKLGRNSSMYRYGLNPGMALNIYVLSLSAVYSTAFAIHLGSTPLLGISALCRLRLPTTQSPTQSRT